MNDKFDAFVAPARRNMKIWRIFAVLIAFAAFYFLGVLGYFQLVEGFLKSTGDRGLSAPSINISTPQGMLFLLSSFVFMFCGIWFAVRLFRPGTLAELLGPKHHIPYLKQATAVLLVFLAVSTCFTLSKATQNMPLLQWLAWLPIALPLLLIQVSAEELVFRGYILQEVAARSSNRFVWLVVPAVIFGALHYDSATYGSNAPLIVAATTIIGIVLADLTIRTGNLRAAIGLHFINNFMAMMVVSLDGSLNGLSLYVTNIHVSDEQAVRGLIYVDVATILTVYVVYLLAIQWKKRQRLQ